MELKLSPPMDNHGHPILIGFQECPILFRVLLTGKWAQQLWVQNNDIVRVIGTFTKENLFTLSIDESHPTDPD